MKRKIALLLAFILMLSNVFTVNVFAANYPSSISSNKYIEFKAQQNIDVYKDTECKTRGTSKPSKKYNASISSGDTCYIYKIEKNYIQVNYPTSSGRRTGYIKRSALFDKTVPVNYISSSKAKVTVYKSSSGSYVAKGDKVWVLDTKKEFSGYEAVMYEAQSGNRAYKLGYVTKDDLNKITGIKSTNKSNKKVSDSVNLKFKLTILYNAAELLPEKKALAKKVMEVACDAELIKNIQNALGVSTIAVATLNPTEMLGVFDASAASGVVALAITKSFYESAVASHNKYLEVSKNIKTTEQADKAFKYCIDAMSKYNAVINANMDTVESYKSLGSASIEMLETYCSSVANAAVPGNEYKAILNACEIATTVTELGDLVGDKYAGYGALKNTVNTWYKNWNRYD